MNLPKLDDVQRAVEDAKRECAGPAKAVIGCGERGQDLALREELPSVIAACRLAQRMEELGYSCLLRGHVDDMRGCDFMFVPTTTIAAAVARTQEAAGFRSGTGSAEAVRFAAGFRGR